MQRAGGTCKVLFCTYLGGYVSLGAYSRLGHRSPMDTSAYVIYVDHAITDEAVQA